MCAESYTWLVCPMALSVVKTMQETWACRLWPFAIAALSPSVRISASWTESAVRCVSSVRMFVGERRYSVKQRAEARKHSETVVWVPNEAISAPKGLHSILVYHK